MKNIPIRFGILIFLLGLTACQKADEPAQEYAAVPEVPFAFPQSTALTRNVEAPDFNVKTLEGDQLKLSDYRGKVVLLNFWATWCGPCIVEIPDLIALQNELGSDNFAVIGISQDMVEEEVVQEFVNSLEINYPNAIDEGKIAQEYGGVYSLPTTFIIDKEGVIKQYTIGIFPAEEYKPHLTSMINAES